VLLVFHSSRDKRLSVETLPPLGILSIAAFLEGKGIHTDVIDFTVDEKAVIHPESYDLVGFSINIANRESSLSEIERVRKLCPSVPIAVGGPVCMSAPEVFTSNEKIDAVFACEGEEALYEYLTATDKSVVKGVYVRAGSDVTFSGARDWITDLDSLPFPALDKVPINRYNNYPKRARPIVSMITSRGCPYGCTFCSHSMGKKWRPRSARHVVEEIDRLVNSFGVREICVYDDNFSLDRQRAEAICDGLVERKTSVRLQFANGLRVDNVDLLLLEKLKAAGMWFMGIAPEVGDPGVLRSIKKGFDLHRVTEIREHCRRLGIITHGFFMIGFPVETVDTILRTIHFAKDLDCEIVEFNKVIPYPQTELFDTLVRTGNLLTDPLTKVKSYHEGTIETHRVGEVPADEVKKLIRSAYREYYLRPKKLVDLLRTFSIGDLFGLALYALRTHNI
jgi:anaerobic magnesium-protoporphyrin IX monomethyl ester cyclase